MWPRLAQRLAQSQRLILFSDFDGTLAPMVRYPWRARLPAGTKRSLARLARSRRVVIGVVSGRELAELRRLVGIRGICYVGSHGLEWVLPGDRPHLAVTRLQLRQIQTVARELQQRLRGLAGVWVERKVASVAVHYRNANRAQARRAIAQVKEIAEGYARQVKCLEGKKVVEILPAGESSKGATVRSLWVHLRRSRVARMVYLGDDATDETAFGHLGNNDIGVFVGRRRRTRARFLLRSPEEVQEFLARLGRIRI